MKLPVSELTPGMYVMELDRPWEESPFLFQGFWIEDQEDVQNLQDVCEYVYIDVQTVVEFQNKPQQGDHKGFTSTKITKKTSVEKDLIKAQKTYDSSGKLVRSILDDVRLGKSIDSNSAKTVVGSCVDSIIGNQDALLLLSRIQENDVQTSEHSLNTAILSIAFGREMELDREQLIELGMCALLHDLGKILVPIDILNKKEPLTASDRGLIQKHTIDGRNLLMSSSNIPQASIHVAHCHHEWIDGSGYPRGLMGDQLSLWTRMIAITDAFDDMTTPHPYKKAKTNMEAFRLLNQERGSHFDSSLVMRFIRTIGIFAPGNTVLLSNGEVGVVIEANEKIALRPRVLVMKSITNEPIHPYLLDLAIKLTTAKGEKLHINKMVHPKEYGIDLAGLKKAGFLMNNSAAKAQA